MKILCILQYRRSFQRGIRGPYKSYDMLVRVFLDARVLRILWTVSNFVFDWTQIKDSLDTGFCAFLSASRTQPTVYLPPARVKVLRFLEIWQRK